VGCEDSQAMPPRLTAVGALHDKIVFDRRVRTLTQHLISLVPPNGKILDVGCGDGTIDSLIEAGAPGTTIEGIDVLVRANAKIPVQHFDGLHIPCRDKSFDVVMFLDVLHHTDDPLPLLREAVRVGKNIIIKDHYRDGFLAGPTLRFMDWVGNAHHGVVLPYNYLTKAEWANAFRTVGVKPVELRESLGLYPAPASWIFERGLHFLGRFEPVQG
jgi:SAM-dependent methyltransferase